MRQQSEFHFTTVISGSVLGLARVVKPVAMAVAMAAKIHVVQGKLGRLRVGALAGNVFVYVIPGSCCVGCVFCQYRSIGECGQTVINERLHGLDRYATDGSRIISHVIPCGVLCRSLLSSASALVDCHEPIETPKCRQIRRS